MDQIKQYLAVAVKYGFWISAAVVLLGSVLTWYLTTSRLAKENAAQTSALNSAVQSVTQVRSELDTQPNELSHAEMSLLVEARKQEVLDSWESLFERQQGLLTWPTEKLTSDMTGPFIGKIPIETYLSFPTEEADELVAPYLRTQYERYIGNQLPDIAKIAKAEWSAPFSKSAAPTMGTMDIGISPFGRGRPTVDISGAAGGPLVKWSVTNQQSLLEDLFPWRGRGKPPTSLEVYYSQENLWILTQMLQIIANVNGDAKQPYQAKIREIVRISIGESVTFGAGTISAPGAGFAMAGMEMMDMDMDMDYGGGDMYEGDGMSGGETVSVDPAENRYVNAKNEPVTGSALRSALTSNSAADAEIAVAKRVPVMMSLQIDQRAIQQLLAECGSAPLMVQVNQVRVLPKDGIATLGGGGMMGMGQDSEMEQEMGGMDMYGGGDEMGMGGMGGGMPQVAQKPVDEYPLDMAVEIYGLINMYNPPDPVKLGVEEIDQDSVIEGVTDGGAATAAAGAAVPATPPAETADVLPTPDATQPDATQPDATAPANPDGPAGADATDPADPDGAPAADPDGAGQPPVAGASASPPPAIVIPTP